jgi:hypothetical protein
LLLVLLSEFRGAFMSKIKILSGGAVAVALILSSITPAYAGWGGNNWGGHGGGWGRGHRDDHIDAGDVIAGIFIIGAIATIAGASKKRQRNRDYPEDRSEDQRGRQDRGQSDRDQSDRGLSESRGKISSENDAVDACAAAVEARVGQAASVRDITDVKSDTDGWDIEGVVEKRDGWRDKSVEQTKFSCAVRFGRVEHVYVDDASLT